jgi:hypothetical protein
MWRDALNTMYRAPIETDPKAQSRAAEVLKHVEIWTS